LTSSMPLRNPFMAHQHLTFLLNDVISYYQRERGEKMEQSRTNANPQCNQLSLVSKSYYYRPQRYFC
jgi:hypothetical protein